MEDFSGLPYDGRTHKQRMLDGDWFWGPDPELIAEGARAQLLCRRIADTYGSDPAANRAALEELFAHVGASFVMPPLVVNYGYQVSIGDQSLINTGVTIVDCATVTIGDRVLVAPGVHLITAEHPVEAAPRALAHTRGRPVVLEDDTWIGAGAIVLPGVTVGARSVVAAGAVVTRDVPADVVVAGTPARVLRSIDQSAAPA